MNQPELGRKIVELRKAKGLTQEELVVRCNINVRTLQRIESGEVTPRSYTLKLIFAELDYHYFEVNGNNKTSNNIRSVLLLRLGQVYRYIIDLFNLKTNTMKKLTILTLTAAFFGLLFFCFSMDSSAQTNENIQKIIEKSNQEFILFFNSGHIDSLMVQYTNHSCLLPENCCGYECIKQHWLEESMKGYKITNLSVISVNAVDTIAVVKGVWKIIFPEGLKMSGMYLTEWHYTDGKVWKIVNDMSGINSFSPEISDKH